MLFEFSRTEVELWQAGLTQETGSTFTFFTFLQFLH